MDYRKNVVASIGEAPFISEVYSNPLVVPSTRDCAVNSRILLAANLRTLRAEKRQWKAILRKSIYSELTTGNRQKILSDVVSLEDIGPEYL